MGKGNEKFVITGIYAPNRNKTEFFKVVEDKLLEFINEEIILLGDLNGVTSLEFDHIDSGGRPRGRLSPTFF